MASEFKVLITDASYKHSIAIQRYLRKAIPGIYLLGHDNARHLGLFRFYNNLDRCIIGIPLESTLISETFDMVIPVSGTAVRTVADICHQRAVLPSIESIEVCFNKALTMALASRLRVPHPRTKLIRSVGELFNTSLDYPCVLKPACETEAKKIYYAYNEDEAKKCARNLFDLIGERSPFGVLVQEFIKGKGCGLFALYSKGTPLRVFMHQRIREYPIKGGASTAARAYYNLKLKDYGLRILDALQWNGVAMAEFKYDEEREEFYLMEINPKFWGSAELGLSAGINYGEDLVRVFQGETLTYSEEYDRSCHFYWPLDDDIVHLLKTRQVHRISEYFRPYAHTNFGQSWPMDMWKAVRTVKQILR